MISMNVNKQALAEANKELLYSVLHHIVRHSEEGLRRDQDELSIAASALMDPGQPLEQRLALVRAMVGGGRLHAIAIYDQIGQWIDTVAAAGPSAADTPPFPKSLDTAERSVVAENTVGLGPGLPISHRQSATSFPYRPSQGGKRAMVFGELL